MIAASRVWGIRSHESTQSAVQLGDACQTYIGYDHNEIIFI